jgi:hypothetical protein
MNESTRAYIYRILVAVSLVVVARGLVSESEVTLWLGVAAAVLSVQLPLAAQAPLARLAASALAPTLAVALLLWLRPRWCQGAVGPQAWAMVLRFAPALGSRPRDPQTRAAGLPSQQH